MTGNQMLKFVLCPVLLLCPASLMCQAKETAPSGKPIVIVDTDIGDDVDDAFAVGLALTSSEIDLRGIAAGWGDTQLRARMLDRLLTSTGQQKAVVVTEGSPHHRNGEAIFTQAVWAQREVARTHVAAVDFILQTVHDNPGKVTIVELAPMSNLADAFAKDPVTFKKIQRIVAMGGSIHEGYARQLRSTPSRPTTEYNIMMEPQAAAAVLASGVPLYLMPLDSTQIKLDEVKRAFLFTRGTPLTDAFAVLYHMWAASTQQTTPTLYDAVAMAYAVDPEICPVTPMRLSISADGHTVEEAGEANSWVCLKSNEQRFFDRFLKQFDAKPYQP